MSLKYKIRVDNLRKAHSVRPLNDTVTYYSILVVLSGRLHYVLNGKEYIAQEGDALFASPGTTRVRFRDEKPAVFFFVNFFADSSLKIDLPNYISGALTSRLRDTILLYDKIGRDHSSYTDEKKSLLIDMMLLFLKESAQKKAQNPHVDKILAFIQTHFRENITLKNIANQVGLTVPYCCAIVKKELGCTIYELILRERILLAEELIKSGDHAIKKIPSMCGFNDYSNFSKSFKKIIGNSPIQYRKKLI